MNWHIDKQQKKNTYGEYEYNGNGDGDNDDEKKGAMHARDS